MPTPLEVPAIPPIEAIAVEAVYLHVAEAKEIEWTPEARLIADAIKKMETGGECFVKGSSGELGCYHYMPSTWEAYSIEIYGEVKEQSVENEEYVTVSKIEKWIESGFTERQIFLMWNQGNTSPCKSGVNRYGVRYDSCQYVEDAMEALIGSP